MPKNPQVGRDSNPEQPLSRPGDAKRTSRPRTRAHAITYQGRFRPLDHRLRQRGRPRGPAPKSNAVLMSRNRPPRGDSGALAPPARPPSGRIPAGEIHSDDGRPPGCVSPGLSRTYPTRLSSWRTQNVPRGTFRRRRSTLAPGALTAAAHGRGSVVLASFVAPVPRVKRGSRIGPNRKQN